MVGVEDEVLDVHSDQVGEASSNGTLTGEGALLASLNAKRTGKMTDIVATIQGEQDRIIRADLNQAVVVQGGPGTGKTAGRVASRGLPVVYASSRVAAFRSAGGRPQLDVPALHRPGAPLAG